MPGTYTQLLYHIVFSTKGRQPWIAPDIADRLLRAFDTALKSCDVVCIEDYNKGVCTHELCQAVIERSRAAGKPVFVDPAASADYAKYRGATAITPNRTEAERATGMTIADEDASEHNARLARKLLEALDLEAVCLTLDRHGALLLERDADPVHIPTVARDVYDVTGAGDMMLAALAAARANGIAWEPSVRFANAAAGLEVQVFGVVPIPLEQVHAELLNQHARHAGKLRTLDELMVQAAAARKAGQRIVFTNGCFDVLHAGHHALLKRAAQFGEFLVVGLNDDHSVRQLKGEHRPINTQADRADLLGAFDVVDAIVLFSEPTPIRLIERLLPDVLVKGADYTEDQVVGGDVVKRAGGRVELIPLIAGLSTTSTLQRLAGA